MKETNLEVALTKQVCRVCGKAVDGDIVMNTRLTKTEAEKVKAMHQQITGFLDKPCDECKKLLTKAFILIGCVESKTTDKNNPYRSGNMWGVTYDYANKLFKGNAPEEGFAIIDVNVASMLGLPDVNLDA